MMFEIANIILVGQVGRIMLQRCCYITVDFPTGVPIKDLVLKSFPFLRRPILFRK
jgi:hypothetical protein